VIDARRIPGRVDGCTSDWFDDSAEVSMHTNEGAASAAGPRQIIVCCDGTNNTLTGGSHDTNVLKLAGHLAPEQENQLVYYDPGVGAPDQMPPLGLLNGLHRKQERIAGLAKGKGVYENIAEAYSFLMENYAPGDEIYIFGFSRGAFTARCVAGMVHTFGIIRADCKPLILTLIRVYFTTPGDSQQQDRNWWAAWAARRTLKNKAKNERLAQDTGMATDNVASADVRTYLTHKKERKVMREEVAEQVRNSFTTSHGRTACTHFVGVWDTVESVGVPLLSRSITSTGFTRNKDGFRHIRQALSMDEHRLSFEPRLYWDEDYTVDDPHDRSNSRSLRQRWFRGVHSDVGGGYDENEAGLSDQAFGWMLAEAIACGLRAPAAAAARRQRAKPRIAHDPCFATPWWGVAGLTVRTNVTHTSKGEERTIRVITEGAAREPVDRIHPVWNAGAVLNDYRFWLALALSCVLALACGWLAYAAFEPGATAGVFDRFRFGAIELDAWQRDYFPACVNDWPRCAHRLKSLPPAFWATVVDFGFIAAYSWLLGLFAAWAFREMAGWRNPNEKVPPLFVLGWAPLIAVAADLIENLLTILTLWSLYWDNPRISLILGLAMMFANLAKWIGLGGSALLVACGIFATSARPRHVHLRA
jgi:uncharacterized protein (DUF2235 family)